MLDKFKKGDTITINHLVGEQDIAEFKSGVVHQVYSTFALGRDAEWACRQFVLQMKEDHEEGIGTFLNVKHQSPALIGSIVDFEAKLVEVKGNNILCAYTASVENRVIATGETGQKILPKSKLEELFKSI